MTRTKPVIPVTAAAPLLAALLLATLTACGSSPSAPVDPPASEPSAEEPSGQEPAADAQYNAPSTCSELLGTALEADILGHGLILFSGPDASGLHPGESVAQDGGDPFYCAYGMDMVDLSTIELAAQAVDQDEHEGIVAVLGEGAFDETADGDWAVFTQVGTEGDDPAIVHLLSADAWITAYSTFGGPDAAAAALQRAQVIRDQVYF